MLALAGYTVRVGLPPAGSKVAVWGAGKTAQRGRRLADINGAQLLHLEDGFLRSVTPAHPNESLSLLMDSRGPYYDASVQTDLELLLQTDPLASPDDLQRAEALIVALTESGVSKYNSALGPVPDPGFVLVVDQTHGDRSIAGAQATADTFRAMLRAAQKEHPARQIVVQRHPETAMGRRRGYFEDVPDGVQVLDTPAPPYPLLRAAHAVYTVSSQLGFEAILLGHRPVVFGQAFYSGWGLTDDRAPAVPRRSRSLTAAQLALGALIKYPLWYDPYHDQLTGPETVIEALAAQSRAYREDKNGSVAVGMRLWKRSSIARFFQDGPVRFAQTQPEAYGRAAETGARVIEWSGRGQAEQNGKPQVVGIEDGFVRSSGLGAQLVPALSMVCDAQGMHYDPETPSTLEELIGRSLALSAAQLERAAQIRARICAEGVTKYNLSDLPQQVSRADKKCILVVGQVEDDASVLFGAVGSIRTNAALYKAARDAHPEAELIFKPHPDVEEGLRLGSTPPDAERIARNADARALIETVDEVWTMTSLLGFEALLRGKRVTTVGIPFYAGWGLTNDLGPADHPAFLRRGKTAPTLDGLVHAALLDYPRYHDPLSGLACPLEVILDRLRDGTIPTPRYSLRGLSKLQGLFSSYSYLWR